MRQIKTENIKGGAFPNVLTKAETIGISKADFENQLNTLLAEGKSTEESVFIIKEVAEEDEEISESEETLVDFEVIHMLQLLDLNQTNTQSISKTESNAHEINGDAKSEKTLSLTAEAHQSIQSAILPEQDESQSSENLIFKGMLKTNQVAKSSQVIVSENELNIPEYNSPKTKQEDVFSTNLPLEPKETNLNVQAMVSEIVTELSALKSQEFVHEEVDILSDNRFSEAQNKTVQKILSNFIELEKSNQTIQVTVNELVTEIPELDSLKPELTQIFTKFVDIEISSQLSNEALKNQQVVLEDLVTEIPELVKVEQQEALTFSNQFAQLEKDHDVNEISEPILTNKVSVSKYLEKIDASMNSLVQAESKLMNQDSETHDIIERKTVVEADDKSIIVKEETPLNQIANSMNEFDPVNRLMAIHQARAPEKTVSQKDFQTYLETFVVEETESTNSPSKTSTARIHMSPEHLGKVDLQIEIHNKELTAKLIVEQEETKEWIDQQVAQLKEKLLTQEISVRDFQVVVNKNNMNDSFMNSEENPFFKQNQKKSQTRKEQLNLKNEENEKKVRAEEKNYSTRNGISILV